MFESILRAIQEYETIIIHRHSRPDGDALGSQIGMKHILRENFPEKTVYAVGDHPRFFSFMADSEMDKIPDSVYEGALAIILDTASRPLISDDRYNNYAPRLLTGLDAERVLQKMKKSTGMDPGAWDDAEGAVLHVSHGDGSL